MPGIESGSQSIRTSPDGCVAVPRPDRRVLRFTGERAAAALNGLVTADLAPLSDGASVYTLVLTPRGRVLAEGTLVQARDEIWLDLAAESVEPIEAHFGRYVPPRFASFSLDPSLKRISILGTQAQQGYRNWTGGSSPADAPTGGAVAARHAWQGDGLDLFLPDGPAALRALEIGCTSGAGDWDGFEAWRISRGLPSYGSDIGPDSLPQETGLDRFAINYEKGCYTGQEVVARIHYRGHVNRHVRLLTSDDPITLECPLFFEGREVGRVTSACPHAEHGWIALATVRREVVPSSTVALHPDGEQNIEVHEQPFTLT